MRLKLHFTLFSPRVEPSSEPQIIRPYILFASPWQTPDSGVATIFPLSGGCPVPDVVHVVSLSGGPLAALLTARDNVLAMSGNAGLSALPPDLDKIEEW